MHRSEFGEVHKLVDEQVSLPFLCERHENDNLFDDKHLRKTRSDGDLTVPLARC
jgi:hypothetical protein